MNLPATILNPNPTEILQHIELLFGRALEGQIEIGWTEAKTHRLQYAHLFDVADLAMAADWAAETNAVPGQNVYVGAALRKPDTPQGRTKDTDFFQAWALYADWDKADALSEAKVVYLKKQLPPPFIVVTGMHPHVRAHPWWLLEEPISDPARYSALLKEIAHHLYGDATVTNPSRVMRLGGSVAWAAKPGRQDEMTELKVDPSRRQQFLPEEFARAFPVTKPAEVGQPANDQRGPLNLHTGVDADALVASIRAGDHWHDHMIKLVLHWANRGFTNNEMLVWAPELTLTGYSVDQTIREMKQAIDSARIKFDLPEPSHAVQDEPEDDGPISMFSLPAAAPPREWLIEDWIPKKTVTALYGDGGVGKSLVAQQLATAVATGGEWLGLPAPKLPVLAIYCEDDLDELHRRQIGINEQLGLLAPAMDQINWGWPRVGHNNILVTFDAHGNATPTGFYKSVIRTVREVNAGLVIIDTVADTFGGSENDRNQVNHFVKTIVGGIVVETGATVLQLAHPSLTGLSTGTGLSGSTAWNNGVRSRLSLTRSETGVPEQRRLTRKKSNYSESGDETSIDLFWKNGVLIPMGGTFDTVDSIEHKAARKRILEEVDEGWKAGKPYVSKKGHPRQIGSALIRQLVDEGFPKEVAARALQRINAADEIKLVRTKDIRGYKVVEEGV